MTQRSSRFTDISRFDEQVFCDICGSGFVLHDRIAWDIYPNPDYDPNVEGRECANGCPVDPDVNPCVCRPILITLGRRCRICIGGKPKLKQEQMPV